MTGVCKHSLRFNLHVKCRLGNDQSWMDHPRDLFLIINHFRQQMRRPLIGVGHSMGGNNLVNLSIMHPRLLTSLILIEPIIQHHPSSNGSFGPAKLSTNRRDSWSSRAEARACFKGSKFYKAWDTRVLDCWIEHGLRDLPGNAVTLKTTKSQEVFTFLRPNFSPENSTPVDVDLSSTPSTQFYRPEPAATSYKLPFLRPSVCYILGAKSYISSASMLANRVAQTGTGIGGSGGAKNDRVSRVILDNVGHLVPMERVADTANAAASWLIPQMREWQESDRIDQETWRHVPLKDRGILDEQFVRTINADESGKEVEKVETKDGLCLHTTTSKM